MEIPHLLPLLALLLAVIAAVTAKPLEFDDEYSGGDDDNEDVVGDVVAPDLVSAPATVRVPLGRRMKLTCRADSALIHHQIIWKKPSGDGSNPKVLSVGTIKVEQDRRLGTRTVNENKAVELTIDSVEEGDAGTYECSISTQPPKSVNFTVTVGGDGTEQEIISDAAVGEAEGVEGGGATTIQVQAGLVVFALGVAVHAFHL